jgi:ribosomal protein S18 acetylase RimI-like enzyme
MFYRNYNQDDYAACEQLVSDAWHFDQLFQPTDLYWFARYVYTCGSITGSNFKKVIEHDGEVIGFIMGRNEKCALKGGSLSLIGLNLRILKRLFTLSGIGFKQKLAFLKKINQHEIARHKIQPRGTSEINLLVIHSDYQKRGIGQHLVHQFIDYCRESAADRIIVEANVVQASKFYKKMGFELIGEFESPLHALTSPALLKAGLYQHIITKRNKHEGHPV